MTTETRTTHTPGPWGITGSGTHGEMIYGKSGRTVAIWPYEGHNAPESVEAMANARLIASAPELLAALEAFVTPDASVTCQDCVDIACGLCGSCECGRSESLAIARAIIAKARGDA